ncbi:hypothetical protein J4471_05285 [Candidatus Woesearchaeota archaeon]|nr:hypothetical protein [Candidatus Woesearchaeota archaeon]
MGQKIQLLIILSVVLLFIGGCNSNTGRAVQEIDEVNKPAPEKEIVKEELKPIEVPKPAPKPVPKAPEAKLKVDFIDVGYGDAVLFQEKENVILVDCGRTDESIYNYLRNHDIKEIDLLIVSVPTREHLGGCDRVMQAFSVKKVMDNGRSPNTEEYDDYDRYRGGTVYDVAKKGQLIQLGDIKIEFMSSNNRLEADNTNAIVMKLSYDDIDFLLTSDCDLECEKKLPAGLQSEILKVSNHGSLLTTGNEFISKVSSEVAVISVSEKNQYNNPKQQVIDRLSKSDIYRTDLDGTVTVETNGKTYSVKTEK